MEPSAESAEVGGQRTGGESSPPPPAGVEGLITSPMGQLGHLAGPVSDPSRTVLAGVTACVCF